MICLLTLVIFHSYDAMFPPGFDFAMQGHSRCCFDESCVEMKLPLGSGAIERTVRRVVNLRLKGPSIFWCRESAEAI